MLTALTIARRRRILWLLASYRGFASSQVEYVRVPVRDVNLLPILNNVADEQALYLSDILPTSFHAVVDTGVKDGDVVGVWVGLLVL